MALRMRVTILGVRETLRAFSEMPAEAQNELRDGSLRIAESLVGPVRAAAAGEGRQAARAATTVQAKRDRVPVLVAGASGDRLGRALLFGSEFGATRHFGWYSKARYYRSTGKQFKPHLGANSYWFFRTVEDEQPRIDRAYNNIAAEICRRWAR